MPRPRPLAALLALAVVGTFVACREKKAPPPSYPTAEAHRGDLDVKAAADGVVEPVRTVEVKSKASGEIVSLPVDTGDHVQEGQVLAQLLPKDAQSSYDQAQADLAAANARLENAKIQLVRAQKLSAQGLIAAEELEAAQLAVTTSQSDQIRSSKNLDIAAERLAETTVRAPISGTVIGRNVEIGQVVSSAVSQVSGGTLLLSLADLKEVQVRSLVDEVDIGRIHVGLPVSIQVEAQPNHRFHGQVVKIEPQAVVDQNVTMFPVLTRIDNREGLLMPGMNAEVEIEVAHRDDVLMVPTDALKSPEEAQQLARILGIGGPSSRRPPAEGEAAAAEPPPRPQAEGAHGRRPNGGSPDGAAGHGGGVRASASDQRVVFRKRADGSLEAVPVEVGLKSWDDAEIRSGLAEGDAVVILPSAAQLRQSAEFVQRIQRMRGMPGMSGNNRSGGGGRRGGGS